jgi:hypothetical protein
MSGDELRGLVNILLCSGREGPTKAEMRPAMNRFLCRLDRREYQAWVETQVQQSLLSTAEAQDLLLNYDQSIPAQRNELANAVRQK